MSSFNLICHVPLRHETLLIAVQLNVFISLLRFLFIVYYLFLKKTLTYSCFRLGGLKGIDGLRSVAYIANSFI